MPRGAVMYLRRSIVFSGGRYSPLFSYEISVGFPTCTDYIFTPKGTLHIGTLVPTPRHGIVVEPFPIQNLAADCPLL